MNIHHDPASRSRSKWKIAESELPLKTAGWMANGAEYRVSMPPGPGSLIGSACHASNRVSAQFLGNWAIGLAGLEPTVSSPRVPPEAGSDPHPPPVMMPSGSHAAGAIGATVSKWRSDIWKDVA